MAKIVERIQAGKFFKVRRQISNLAPKTFSEFGMILICPKCSKVHSFQAMGKVIYCDGSFKDLSCNIYLQLFGSTLYLSNELLEEDVEPLLTY